MIPLFRKSAEYPNQSKISSIFQLMTRKNEISSAD